MVFPAFTVFDVETTGLDPAKGHRIIEIAGVRVENGEIRTEQAFVELVNPERSLPPEAQQVNKIEQSDVQGAPTIDVVLPQFLEFAAGSILVAHNADFDMKFLENEKTCCWGYIELPECLCTLRLSRALYPTAFRHNLDELQHRFNLPPCEARHRALPDVILTAQALLTMIDQHSIDSIDTLRTQAGVRQLAAA